MEAPEQCLHCCDTVPSNVGLFRSLFVVLVTLIWCGQGLKRGSGYFTLLESRKKQQHTPGSVTAPVLLQPASLWLTCVSKQSTGHTPCACAHQDFRDSLCLLLMRFLMLKANTITWEYIILFLWWAKGLSDKFSTSQTLIITSHGNNQ